MAMRQEMKKENSMMNKKWFIVMMVSCFGLIALFACKNSENPQVSQTSPAIAGQEASKTGEAVQANPELDKKIKEIEVMLATNPADVPALTALADLYLQKGEVEKSMSLIDKALVSSPSDPALLRLKADGFARQHKTEAIELYQKAIASAGDKENFKKVKSFSYLGLARYYLGLNNKQKALECAEKAISVDKEDSFAADFIKSLQK